MAHGSARYLPAVALFVACGPVRGADDISSGGTSGSSDVTSSSTTTTTPEPTSTTTTDTTTSTVSTAPVDTSGESTSTTEPPPDVGFAGCPNEWQPPGCWEFVCDLFDCGQVHSMFEADGCPRQVCESDADCSKGEDCRARTMSRACSTSGPESCETKFGEDCVCGGSLGCGGDPRGFCVDATEFPPDEACRALSIECEHLDPWFVDGYYAVTDVMDEMSAELRTEVLQCQADYVARLIDECAADVCFVLCNEVGVAGCAGKFDCDEFCPAADPANARALALVLAADPTACSDCATCPEGDELCASLWGCG